VFDRTFKTTSSQTTETPTKLSVNLKKEGYPMKKLLIFALVLAYGLGFTAKAEAAERGGPLWVCQMGFRGEAKGFKVLLGKYRFQADGTMNCVSMFGHIVHYPITLSMNALPLSPGVAIGKYKVYGQSGEVSLFNCDPDELLGKYMIAQAHATILGGVGAITAVKLGNPQLAVGLSINVQKGFGFDVSINQLRIMPREYNSVNPD
jgi:hypothetical protein